MPQAGRAKQTITVAEAAKRLGCTTQTVRNWLLAGKLTGYQSGKRRIWHVDEASVTPLIRPGSTSPLVVSGEVHEVLEQLRQLMGRELAAERLVRAIEADRDRYRADAATSREAALRVNAAARDLRDVVQRLVGVLDEQSEALTQLLAPATPADVFPESSAR